MSKITEYTNEFGTKLISIQNEDGTTWSGLKSAYDEMIANEAATL